jgi:glucose-1-phosphate thymidylyltransferase
MQAVAWKFSGAAFPGWMRTHESLIEASTFIETIEHRQGFKIACPEEIAYRAGFIDIGQLARLTEPLAKSNYGQYLLHIVEEDRML